MTASEPTAPATPEAPGTTVAPNPFLHQVLKVAWMSIGLGIAFEILLLVVAAFTGTAGESGKPALADLAQKVSWSFLVCVGLAFGTAVKKMREAAMGAFGLFAAPLAFVSAKAVHKALGQALGTIAPGAPLAVPLLIAGLKGLEYGVLGALLGYAIQRGKSLGFHVGTGLAIGLTFGTLLIWAGVRSAPAPVGAVDLIGRGINEILFPLGCSMVIYASEVFARRFRGEVATS